MNPGDQHADHTDSGMAPQKFEVKRTDMDHASMGYGRCLFA